MAGNTKLNIITSAKVIVVPISTKKRGVLFHPSLIDDIFFRRTTIPAITSPMLRDPNKGRIGPFSTLIIIPSGENSATLLKIRGVNVKIDVTNVAGKRKKL